jgi:transposase
MCTNDVARRAQRNPLVSRVKNPLTIFTAFLSHEKLQESEVWMALGRPLSELTLSASENNTLVEWKRRAKTSQALALRARIILACAQGGSNSEVTRSLRVTKQTVGKWRSRFVQQRLDGLLDEPRPGTPRRLDDARIEQLVATTLNERPRDATKHRGASVTRLRLAAASLRELQALQRPAVHLEGARHRGLVP